MGWDGVGSDGGEETDSFTPQQQHLLDKKARTDTLTRLTKAQARMFPHRLSSFTMQGIDRHRRTDLCRLEVLRRNGGTALCICGCGQAHPRERHPHLRIIRPQRGEKQQCLKICRSKGPAQKLLYVCRYWTPAPSPLVGTRQAEKYWPWTHPFGSLPSLPRQHRSWGKWLALLHERSLHESRCTYSREVHETCRHITRPISTADLPLATGTGKPASAFPPPPPRGQTSPGQPPLWGLVSPAEPSLPPAVGGAREREQRPKTTAAVASDTTETSTRKR